jgi:16S rRNA (guanine(1405)-N(7))-methyltransferase
VKFDAAPLDALVADISGSAKYRTLSPDLIRRIGSAELANRPSLKVAIQETRSRLHQSAGAYLDSTPPYSRWLAALDSAEDADLPDLFLQFMRSHASTRERLPLLQQQFREVIQAVGPVTSVLDVACGLNPLAFPFMGLPSDVRYHGCDLYSDMMQFLNCCYRRLGVHGEFTVADAVGQPPISPADVAFILKFLPVVEQNRRGGALAWLQSIPANTLVVSFPTGSLSGRGKGMATNYETRFLETIAPTGWTAEKLLYPGELFFIVRKSPAA